MRCFCENCKSKGDERGMRIVSCNRRDCDLQVSGEGNIFKTGPSQPLLHTLDYGLLCMMHWHDKDNCKVFLS